MLGDRIEDGPEICCDDNDRTGSAERPRGAPAKWRSKVPVNVPVRLLYMLSVCKIEN